MWRAKRLCYNKNNGESGAAEKLAESLGVVGGGANGVVLWCVLFWDCNFG